MRREDFRGADISDPDLTPLNQNVSPSTTQFTRIGASQSVKRALSVSLRRAGGMTKVVVSYRSGISGECREGTPMAIARIAIGSHNKKAQRRHAFCSGWNRL
ncbi:hypothetical protein IVA94_38530 [Bradyrhizobium sp. 156]|nr:hypothetical protein [Bradyrhizobium sp. 156]